MEKNTTQNASFTLLRSYYEAYLKMSDQGKLQYMDAIMAYGFDGVEPTLTDPMADMAFALIRPTLEHSVQYHAIKRECGAKGGRPKKQKSDEKNQTETKRKPNDNQTETEKKRECESDSEGYSDSENESDNDSQSESIAACAAKIAPGAQEMGKEKISLEDFDRLWRAYPNKEDRQGALREYFNTDLPSALLLPVIKQQKEVYETHRELAVPPLSTWLECGMYVHKYSILAKKKPGQSPGMGFS